MKTLEYRTTDKSTWGDGPWQTEPDKRQWLDKSTGLPCLIVRGPFGGLCGYVGVPPWHPAFETPYSEMDVEVHGGLTFADFCQTGEPVENSICHIVDDGEEDRVWWFGFDCGHYGDMMPGYRRDLIAQMFDGHCREGVYRTFAYVKSNVRNLAKQLADLATKQQPSAGSDD